MYIFGIKGLSQNKGIFIRKILDNLKELYFFTENNMKNVSNYKFLRQSTSNNFSNNGNNKGIHYINIKSNCDMPYKNDKNLKIRNIFNNYKKF